MEYNAPKPNNDMVKTFLPRILFPPILLWDGLKFIGSKIRAKAYGRKFFPGQGIPQNDKPIIDDEFKRALDYEAFYDVLKSGTSINPNMKNHKKWYEKHTIVTHDGCELDTLELKSPIQNAPENKKYIIHFHCGHASYEQNLRDLRIDVRDTGCNVIGFDYRGINRSTGAATIEGAIIDGIAQINFLLLKQRVQAENIILKGHGMGAAIATEVAAYCHEQGDRVNLFSMSSPASLTKLIVGKKLTDGKSGYKKTSRLRECASFIKRLAS